MPRPAASPPSPRSTRSAAPGCRPSRLTTRDAFTPTVPLMVDVNAGLEKAFSAELLNEELIKVRRALYFDLGIVFPGIQLRYNDRLPPENYSIMLAEIPVSQGRLRPGHLLVRENAGEPGRAVDPVRDRQEIPAEPGHHLDARRPQGLSKPRRHRVPGTDAAAQLPHRLRAQEVRGRFHRHPGNPRARCRAWRRVFPSSRRSCSASCRSTRSPRSCSGWPPSRCRAATCAP